MTRTDKFNTGKLQDKETRKFFRKAARGELVNTGNNGVGSINDRCTNTEGSIIKAAEEVLGKETRAARKPWIDKETLELMNERRRHKNAREEQGERQYSRRRNKVQIRCRKARKNLLKEKFKEVESLFKIGKVDTAHRKMRLKGLAW